LKRSTNVTGLSSIPLQKSLNKALTNSRRRWISCSSGELMAATLIEFPERTLIQRELWFPPLLSRHQFRPQRLMERSWVARNIWPAF
jgi:hypothetical protein